MATGGVSQVSVKTDKGTIVLMPAGSKAILTALTEPEAQLGLILVEMESIAQEVSQVMGESK